MEFPLRDAPCAYVKYDPWQIGLGIGRLPDAARRFAHVAQHGGFNRNAWWVQDFLCLVQRKLVDCRKQLDFGPEPRAQPVARRDPEVIDVAGRQLTPPLH